MEQLRQVVCSCTTTTTSTALSSAKRRRHVTCLFGTFAQLCYLLISPPGCTKRGSRWAYNLRRLICTQGWLGSRVVSVLDSFAEAPGFKSQPRRCRVTVTVHTHCAFVHQAAKLVAALLRVAGVTAGLAESNGSLPPGL